MSKARWSSIRYVRLQHGVEVNWNERQRLAVWMAAEGEKVGAWLQRLRVAKRLDKTTMRERRWLQSMPDDDRSADEGFHLSSEAETKARRYLQAVRDMNPHGFGNARVIELDLFPRMKEQFAMRLTAAPDSADDDDFMFQADDVPEVP